MISKVTQFSPRSLRTCSPTTPSTTLVVPIDKAATSHPPCLGLGHLLFKFISDRRGTKVPTCATVPTETDWLATTMAEVAHNGGNVHGLCIEKSEEASDMR